MFASQSVHDPAAETVEYLPAAHSVHVEAPVSVPVFVIEPAVHSVHDATLEAVEYLPATHAVHAMVAFSLVAKPAAHGRQAPPVAE